MKSDEKRRFFRLVTAAVFLILSASAAAQEAPEYYEEEAFEKPSLPPLPPPARGETAAQQSAPATEGRPSGTEVATDVTQPLGDEEKVYLNVQDAPIKDIIKQISKATGRNFIMDEKKVRGNVTIISEKPLTREEAYQTFLSALEVAGYTTVKGPANVIKIVPTSDAAASPIPTHVDTTPYTDNFVTRLIALENISARDMAEALKQLVKRPGTIDVYDQTNTLIITDTGSNINRIMKIVKELDLEGPQQVMEIIPIRNARAPDIAKMVNDLFEREKAETARRGRTPAPAGEMQEVKKIIADERTNSIIVIASKRAIEGVREIISRLDARLRPEEEGNFHVYYLQHAGAEEMEKVLSSICSGAGGAAKGGAAAAAPITSSCSVKADKGTNALIIQALPKDFTTIVTKVISKLDVPRQQVYFEAVVMEMVLTKGSEYGVGGYGGAGLGGSVIGMGETLGGPSLLGSILGGTASQGTNAWPAFLGGLISSRTTDITYVGADGSTQTLTIPAFSAFISALASRGEANVISTPNLLTLDNETATMKVQTKEPTPGSTTFGASGITTATSVNYEDAGLELEITPQITKGDMIKLHIKQKLSDFSAPRFSTNLQAPAKRERQVETHVVTENGQTVVLAGLMEDSERRNKRKIPILGDIPILGILFSRTDLSISKNNLLIFITPYIVKDSTDFSAILKRKVQERNRFLEANFSKSKVRQIRETIKMHREDLLEFKEEMGASPAIVEKGAKLPMVEPRPKKVLSPPSPVYTPPRVEETPYPVITVPSTRGGMSSRGAVDSSGWKPVKPPKKEASTIQEKAAQELEKTRLKKERAVKRPAEEVLEPVESSASKPVQWLPPPIVKAEPSKEKAKEQPVVTATEKVKKEFKEDREPKARLELVPEEEGKAYRKPEPRSRNGEIDLAY